MSLTLVAVIYTNKRRHKWSLKKAEQWFLTTDIKFSRFTALFFKHGYSVDYLENPYIENQPSKLFRLLNSYFACHHIFKEPKKGHIVNVDCQYLTLVLDFSIQNAAIMSDQALYFLYVCFLSGLKCFVLFCSASRQQLSRSSCSQSV